MVTTSIKINKQTVNKLKELKKNESMSYDIVINMLIDHEEQYQLLKKVYENLLKDD